MRWEFPVYWDSVRKVVRFNHDKDSSFSRDQIVEWAREKMRNGEVHVGFVQQSVCGGNHNRR